MTMYREATVADRRSRLGFQTWVVPVKPTDRICERHLGWDAQLGTRHCINWRPGQPACYWVDVVRTEREPA